MDGLYIDGKEVIGHPRAVQTTLADDATYDLPDASAGFGQVLVGDGEEHAMFSWTTAGVVSLPIASANVVAADTDGKFCIFDNGTQVRIRNRLADTKSIMLDIHYTTSPVTGA